MPKDTKARNHWDANILKIMRRDGVFCSRGRDTDGFVSRNHRHVGIEILYCITGSGTVSIDNEVLPYSKGDLIYFNSEIPHQIEVPGTYERWNLCIWQETLTDLASGHQLPNFSQIVDPRLFKFRTFHIPDSENRQFYTLFEDIQTALFQMRGNLSLYLRCKIIELFILLDWISEIQPQNKLPSPGQNRLGHILNYIDQHLAQNPSVESIASTFHYSPSHLYRLIRSATGKTPSEYIRSRKVDRAKKLLIDSELTVRRIARAVGTSNVSYFCKMFRDEVGFTPQEFRFNHLSSKTMKPVNL